LLVVLLLLLLSRLLVVVVLLVCHGARSIGAGGSAKSHRRVIEALASDVFKKQLKWAAPSTVGLQAFESGRRLSQRRQARSVGWKKGEKAWGAALLCEARTISSCVKVRRFEDSALQLRSLPRRHVEINERLYGCPAAAGSKIGAEGPKRKRGRAAQSDRSPSTVECSTADHGAQETPSDSLKLGATRFPQGRTRTPQPLQPLEAAGATQEQGAEAVDQFVWWCTLAVQTRARYCRQICFKDT
jgi:hypothetical protein